MKQAGEWRINLRQQVLQQYSSMGRDSQRIINQSRIMPRIIIQEEDEELLISNSPISVDLVGGAKLQQEELLRNICQNGPISTVAVSLKPKEMNGLRSGKWPGLRHR